MSFSTACKARIDMAAFAARLKSCPDTKPEFFTKFLVFDRMKKFH
jgi:hypothetical protein